MQKRKPGKPGYKGSLMQALEQSSKEQQGQRPMPGQRPMRPKGKPPAKCAY